MAGKPKTRKQRERQQLGDYPAATTEGAGAGAHDARVQERERRPYVPVRPAAAQPPGATTKRRADEAVADELQALAEELRPGIVVRLERLRPGWAAGFLEEYPLQDGDLSELYDHVQAEHGGQLYKVTVLNADGKAWYDSRIRIAGPPRERGRIIDRDAYEGIANPKASPQQTPKQDAAPTGSGSPDLMSVFSLMLQQQQKASEAQLEAVREMVGRQTDQTRELIATIVEQRGEDRRHKTISGQLEELSEAGKTMDKVRKMFGEQGSESGGDTDPIVKEAMAHFARNFFGSQSGQGAQQGANQPPSRMPRARRAPADNVIPMGVAEGNRGGES